jgi:ribosome biogenesis GTPase
MPELREALKDKDSVFSGQSGTGKSSLINWLEPGLDLDTAEVSDFNEKGKHTTSQSILIPWSFGGHILDTPGIKTINLHSDAKPMLPKIFPGFSKLAERCRFRDCTHSHEEDCSVLDALEAGNIPLERYESYLRIMDSL